MKKRICSIFLALAMLFSISVAALAAPEQSEDVIRYSIVDSHLHYQDFTQKSQGFEPLAHAMFAAGVEGAVIFGMPMTKMWDEHLPTQPAYYMSDDSPTYYFSGTDYILAEELQRFNSQGECPVKFYPFACGVNANDKFAGDQLRHLFELYPDTFYGIGEIMLRHDDLTALTYGEAPRANSPGMYSIVDLASELVARPPILIHQNITASYEKNQLLYRDELIELLKYANNQPNPVNIIWAHSGASRRIELPNAVMVGNASELLSLYKNLYIDLSWVIFDDFIMKNEENLMSWVSLIRQFPDRLMIGSDKVGNWGEDGQAYQKEIVKYYALAEAIGDPSICEKLFSLNILELLPEKAINPYER